MSSLKIAAVGVLLTAGLSHAYFPVLDKVRAQSKFKYSSSSLTKLH